MSNQLDVSAGTKRDRFALKKAQLLADYAAISKKRRGAAESTSLRVQSRQYLDIMAFEASSGTFGWGELRDALLDSSSLADRALDPMVIAEIGRVLLLQQLYDEDTLLGVAALEYAVTELPRNVKSRRFRKLLVDHYILNHEYARARNLLDAWPDVDREFHNYLRAELANPFYVRDAGNLTEWLAKFNQMFETHGLATIRLAAGSDAPFDRLDAEAPAAESSKDRGVSTPKVSVIVTTFKPGRSELFTAVRSVLAQTYSNIEVVLVDDASGPEFNETIEAVGLMDDRIVVVHAEENGGTYLARNIGLSTATGEYLTGQDDDDWSHPERIAEQVSFLQENPDAVGCRVASITCLPDLSRVRLGYKPMSANASSLMMKRETFELIGGFMAARKAADTELHKRAERATGRSVIDIEKPLAVVRIEADSLSRGDFRAGWSHPARRQFKFSYAHWQAHAPRTDLKVGAAAVPQVSIPRRFRIDRDTFPAHFDVVFAGDWRQYGGPQRSMLEEIRALTSQGLAIGVMQLEAPRFMTKVQKPLTSHIQELINNGTVTEVLYDDPVEVELLILRYPPILQFAIAVPSELQVHRMIILANQAPSELDGSDIRYLVPDCTQNARAMFCEDVLWVPQGAQVRNAIAPYLEKTDISTFDIPGMVDAEEWHRDHSLRRSSLPVVGRHSRDNTMKWPEDPAVIERVYPSSGLFDVRILGGANTGLRILETDVVPAGWTVYETDALPVPTFLETLDFYVFYQNSVAVEAFGRSILEAIASGVVVILPTHYHEVFGGAAIYAHPTEVQEVVREYHNDRELYMRQVREAQAVVADRYSHGAYSRLIGELLEEVRT